MKDIKISKKYDAKNKYDAKIGSFYIFSDYDVDEFGELLRYGFFSKLDNIIDVEYSFFSKETGARFRFLYEIDYKSTGSYKRMNIKEKIPILCALANILCGILILLLFIWFYRASWGV